ncbi:hypothetical protein BU17DRAFT_37707 [Hysterangium stoloniferum]|nr:hypothetical protein BU17DRAFT_37707 [Hysterangium stoloniferum]
MHLVFNALRAFTFGACCSPRSVISPDSLYTPVVILAWSLIVLAIAVHFHLVLVSSELTHFVPLALFASAFTIVMIMSLLVLSTLRKVNPVSTRMELVCVGAVGSVWLALGLVMATSPSQDADVECFSESDGSLEVTGFTTDTFHAQYRVVEAFSLFNVILSWGYFFTLLVLALRHFHLGWKRVWQTPATTSPLQRRSSHKPSHRSASLPAPATARTAEKASKDRPRHNTHTSNRDRDRNRERDGDGTRRQAPPPRNPSSGRTKPSRGGENYRIYVQEANVSRPAAIHPRTHRRVTS